MGRDKAQLDYHGRPQVVWAHELLARLCERAYVSIGPDKVDAPGYAGLPSIADREGGLGPASGLLAAWVFAPQVAWLVLAADMPLVDIPMLQTLIACRDPHAIATAFRHADGSLEPLCTIWEPGAKTFVAAPASLQRVLENSSVRALLLDHPDRLASVNTVEEDANVRANLAARGRSTPLS
jgi:molybdenum cofactor guanylyltransferase